MTAISNLQQSVTDHFHHGKDFVIDQTADVTNYLANELNHQNSFLARHPVLSTAGRIVSLLCVNTLFCCTAIEINKNLSTTLGNRGLVPLTKAFVNYALPATFTVLTAKLFKLAITPLTTVGLSVFATTVVLLNYSKK